MNKVTMFKITRKWWNLERREDLEITEVCEWALVFEFRRREDYLRILRGCPWEIQGSTINIQSWKESNCYNEDFVRISNKYVKRVLMFKIIRKGWNLERREDLEINEVNKRALVFKFRRRKDYLRILCWCPRAIHGSIINIQPWKDK